MFKLVLEKAEEPEIKLPRGLQETRVATREESGVLGFPSRRGLTPRGSLECLMGFLRLLRPWGFSHEARRGRQGAFRAAPGKSGLHARGEGERVLALESRECATPEMAAH